MTSIVGKVHNNQGSWLCKEGNTTAPFTHVSTLCEVCGSYWGTQYVHKGVGDEVPVLQPELDVDDWSTYSHGQFGNRSVAFMRQAVAAGKVWLSRWVLGPLGALSEALWSL